MKAASIFCVLLGALLANVCQGKPGDVTKFISQNINSNFRFEKETQPFHRILKEYEHCAEKADGIRNEEFLKVMDKKFYYYVRCIAENRGTYYEPYQDAGLVEGCVVKPIQTEMENLGNKLSDEDKGIINSALECTRKTIKMMRDNRSSYIKKKTG